MKHLQLQPRLRLLADMVPAGAHLADIGTDHGYLPVWLMQQGRIASAIAADIGPEPLAHARRTAAEYGAALDLRLCDGLRGIAPHEADTLVMAGMGGETIIQILTDSPWPRTSGCTLLLQPQSRAEALRRFQAQFGLSADAAMGPATYEKLRDVSVGIGSRQPVHVDPRYPGYVLQRGSSGDPVRFVQSYLSALGGSIPKLTIDGKFGAATQNAVSVFQAQHGLKVDGKAGYETQTALYSDSAIRGNANNTTDTSGTLVNTLRYGSEGNEVTTLQNRLIALGYLAGSADGKFGRDTKSAVIAFQKANGLSADGVVGTDTSTKLYASNVVSNTVSSTQTLRVGAVSDAVRDMQNRLITLGYLENGEADGKFGVKTSLALIEFQKANGLSADGVAGVKTFAKLNSVSAITAGGTGSSPSSGATTTTTAAAPTVTTISASQVRYANWYSEVKARCRLFPNATIYDFTTGISWQVNIFSMGAHADAEPLTAQDTAEMNRAFGGKTTWTPKAVWVVLSDGTVYMASTHNTPHDTYHIRDNNFDGHICIHFPRTQAQVEKIGPYATSHQKAIDLGWETTLKLAAYY